MTDSHWDIVATDFPQSASISEKIHFMLRYAILAPSAHNTQPWRIEVIDNVLNVYRDPKYTLQVGDPTLRETFLSLGAFIENFVVAANHWSYKTGVSYLAQTTNDLLVSKIVLELVDATTTGDGLFEGIVKRHTNRGQYHTDALLQDKVDRLANLALPETNIFTITDIDSKKRIASLVGKGTYIALSMNGMRRELVGFVSHEDEGRAVGMTVEAMSEHAPVGDTSNWILHEFSPQEEADRWEAGFATSPVIVVVASEYDGPEAWLIAGRTLQRVLLWGAKQGLAHCISAAPVEIPSLAPFLRNEIDIQLRPQALVRLGIPKNQEFTRLSNRRPVE